MPQLLTKPAQKEKKARGASASGAVKVATPKGTSTKRTGKQTTGKAQTTGKTQMTGKAQTTGKTQMTGKAQTTGQARTTRKPQPTKGQLSAQRRSRRTPVEILQELKYKRDRLHEAMSERLSRLDERIAKLESRHSSKIKVTELIQSHSAEELQHALESIRKQRSLLRRALKERVGS